jgi:hypothetical protein
MLIRELFDKDRLFSELKIVLNNFITQVIWKVPLMYFQTQGNSVTLVWDE